MCGTQFAAGPQFAEQYLSEASPSNPDLMARVENLNCWPSSILVDSLLQNEDVSDRHVLITFNKNTGASRYWHVDHGHSLGIAQGWATLSASNLSVRSGLYSSLVSGLDPFKDALSRLPLLTTNFAKTVLNECPLDAWGVTSVDCEGLTSYLSTVAARAESMIINGKGTWPNWKSDERRV